MAEKSQKENALVIREFHEAVNMTSSQLEKWLATDNSKVVGQKKEGIDESVGHQSGHQIIAILHKKQEDYTEEDFAHMHKVVGYVHRHLAQKPDGDVSNTHWRFSLMNWGHDPLKDGHGK